MMQEYIIQQIYNFIGNEGFDGKTEYMTQKIIKKDGEDLTEDDKEDFLGMLMEFDRSSFEEGIKAVCAFFSGNGF